jgi:aspartate/methionine/tyrosine aminotransferase
LSSIPSHPAATPSTPPQADDFFAAPNYSAWVRGTLRAAGQHPDPAILYGSSISEPTDELVAVVREAFAARLTSRYISVFSDGNRYVTQAICARYGVKPEQVITTTGVTSALSMILKALLSFGDQVLVEQPGFDLLSTLAREAGAVVTPLPRRAPDFRIDLGDLTKLLTDRTRMILISNLHNPSGALLSASDIRAIAAAAAKVGAVVVVDDVYADFGRPEAPSPAALLAPNVISANSLTKVFGLHSLKCGWMIGAPELLDRIQNEFSEGDFSISKLSHAVAAHVLESSSIFDNRWHNILAATRPVLEEYGKAMIADGLIAGAVPKYGCMYFPQVLQTRDTLRLARGLWEQHGILVAPGEFFGMPGHIRIGCGGTADELNTGLARLHKALRDQRAH